MVDQIGNHMADRGSAPRWMLANRTLCIPKGEYHSDAQAVVRQSTGLRLITLMTTLAKIVACQVDRPLAAVAAATVATPQRGFIAGRSINENIYELEGSCVQFSCVGRDAAILLLDFQAAFPSLDRLCMFSVL